jgi:hypothetical protein
MIEAPVARMERSDIRERSPGSDEMPRISLRPIRATISRADCYDFPYTGTIAPRVTLLSGDARNRIVAATSSTLGHSA